MLLLAVDTSGKDGSLALVRVAPDQSEIDLAEDVLEVVQLAGGAFSAQLVPQIAALLAKHGYSKTDLGAFAVASGPGSFTGLRVGLAAIKALAEVLEKPIAAVSLLEAVAASSVADDKEPERVFAVLDAGRGDMYVGDYDQVPKLEMRSERLLSREEFFAETNRIETKHKAIVTPNTGLAEIVRTAGFQVDLVDQPTSAMIARLGWQHLQRGETVRPEDLEANYIRRSDAEIFSKPAF